MTRGRAVTERASAFWALLLLVPACGSDGDEAFELGSGAFPWSSLVITATGELEPASIAPAAPPAEWKRDFATDACSLTGVIYGVAWIVPCEGSAAARVAACAPDPDLADTQRCTVTLDTFALTLRPDFDEPVLEGATIELASPVVTQEGWSFTGLGGARTNVTGTLTVAGRDGGAPTRYALDSFELEFDYLSSRSFLDLDARKPGW